MLKARLAVLYWLLAAGLIVGCAQPMHAVGEQRSAAAGAALGPGDYQIYWIGPAHQEIPTASQLVVDVVSDSTRSVATSPGSRAMLATKLTSAAWRTITPFGLPVDPDV